MMKSNRALSPVIAAIMLIALSAGVSIAVAAWMGALSFPSLALTGKPVAYSIPSYPNATHCDWSITGNGILNSSKSIVPLPAYAWLPHTGQNLTLDVIYYREIQPRYFMRLAEVTYVIEETTK